MAGCVKASPKALIRGLFICVLRHSSQSWQIRSSVSGSPSARNNRDLKFVSFSSLSQRDKHFKTNVYFMKMIIQDHFKLCQLLGDLKTAILRAGYSASAHLHRVNSKSSSFCSKRVNLCLTFKSISMFCVPWSMIIGYWQGSASWLFIIL